MDYIKTVSNLPFDIKTLLFLAVSGVLVKIFLSGKVSEDGSTGPASSAVWGYGLTTFSLFGLLIIVLGMTSQQTMREDIWTTIKKVFTSSFPLIATLLVLSWLVILYTTNSIRINQGRVAPEFNQFSFASSFLIVLQLIVVFKYLIDKSNINLGQANKDSAMGKILGALTSELTSIVIILTLLNLIFVGMMQIIVEFFSTDG